jgi:hypothetical protein
MNGAPAGQAVPGGINNSANTAGAQGNNAPVAPGTNSLGTAQSTGSSVTNSGGGGRTTGAATNQAGANGGRIDGTVQKGPPMEGDDEIRKANEQADKKIKSICKGC